MNQHYICTGGCKGISDKPGVCQTEGCPKQGHPLELCDCAGGQHFGRLEVKHQERESSDENRGFKKLL